MDTALTVQELRMVGDGHDCSMPYVWMEVEPAAAITPKRDEPLRCHVVARQGERHDEALAVQRTEELAAIGMISTTAGRGISLGRFVRSARPRRARRSRS